MEVEGKLRDGQIGGKTSAAVDRVSSRGTNAAVIGNPGQKKKKAKSDSESEISNDVCHPTVAAGALP